jgi:hypothetical protein
MWKQKKKKQTNMNTIIKLCAAFKNISVYHAEVGCVLKIPGYIRLRKKFG